METSSGDIDGHFKPLAPIYFILTTIWGCSAVAWTFNTCKNGQFQQHNHKLQWMLASVPWIKSLQLSLSFIFWYSYIYSELCSLWISFGVYIMGILFQTCAFVSFFLISHGYCITRHRLALSERRTMSLQACVCYMTLVGYKASVPYFPMLLLINYLFVFYVIFNHISLNLTVLRDQLSYTEDENIHTKYTKLKKFQGAMHIVAVSELAVFISMDHSLESYWIRLLIREWAHFFVFLYIGCEELSPRFSLMPTLSSKRETTPVPPIYSIEMDAQSFKEWHIGVPTLARRGSLEDSVVVVILQPH